MMLLSILKGEMDNEPDKQPHLTNWALIVIYVLAAILLVVLVWFSDDVVNLYRSGVISPAISRIHRRSLGGLTISAGQIQGWMTFRYVNYVFRLPANYLPTKLNISDAKYPNLTLEKYAADHKVADTVFVQSVRDAVAAHQGGESP